VEGSYIKHQDKRRDRRALRGADGDRTEDLWCAFENEPALAF